jgi:prepilin-type N-terminal cleavage/methylation domain-containing protein
VNNVPSPVPSRRRGFSLIEVTLAIGILGLAILSLVGILSATFSQVSEIMETNRALSGVTRLIGALDNPRTIVHIGAGDTASTNTKFLHQGISTIDPVPGGAPNFDLTYRLLSTATTPANAVWLYVYDRRSVGLDRASRVGGGLETFDIPRTLPRWRSPSSRIVISPSTWAPSATSSVPRCACA